MWILFISNKQREKKRQNIEIYMSRKKKKQKGKKKREKKINMSVKKMKKCKKIHSPARV